MPSEPNSISEPQLIEEVDNILDLIDEARKKIGLRNARRIRHVRPLKKAQAKAVKQTKRIARPWRVKAANTRHR